jgi:hypothetical protein
MSLIDGNKSVLKFNLLAESLNILSPKGKSPWQLMNKLNSADWMDKEPGSCRVIDIQQKQSVPVGKTAMMDHAEFLILVGYRPCALHEILASFCREIPSVVPPGASAHAAPPGATGRLRPAQLVGQSRQRLGLAQLRRQPLQQGADPLVLLGAEHGGFAEGPLQLGVARLAVAGADPLAG